MCGRYELALKGARIAELLELTEGSLAAWPSEARLDVRPTELVPLVINTDPHQLQLAAWGIGSAKTINVRDDRLDTTWRGAAESRRCLIPATAFFEWRAVPGEKRKRKVRFAMRDGQPFLFAGIWARGDGPLSCAIITTSPSSLVAPVHDRMPAILREDALELWRAPGKIDLEAARAVIAAYPPAAMLAEEMPESSGPPAQGSLF